MKQSSTFLKISLLLFACVVLTSLWALTREWDKPLLDLHSFRQTQTAISAYYMVGNPSVFLDYITPVLGKPWRIPMEVPFYQWIVARWHEWTGMGLDQSGKFISIIFLFACLWPVWKLLQELSIPPAPRWLTAAVFLSVPLHLYWGRAFLIETMGVFLSLSMAACIFAGYQKKNWHWLLVGLAFGILAAPVPFFGYWFVPLLLIAGALANPKRLPLLLIFLVGFAAGPLIFTNLYFEHNYYWVANGAWLVLALGVALAAISEFRPKDVWPEYTAAALSAVLCIAGLAAWHSKFLPLLQNLPDREKLAEAWIGPIQKLVPPERSILILGNDWNPNALYYAERKGIGYPSVAGVPFPSPLFEKSLTKFTKEDRLGAVVINEQILTGLDKPLLMAQLERLGMSPKATRTGFGVAFPAKDLSQ
jgi:hypothetical protein